jgi:hypothetical protein
MLGGGGEIFTPATPPSTNIFSQDIMPLLDCFLKSIPFEMAKIAVW